MSEIKQQRTATWVSSVAVVLFAGLVSPQASALFSDDEARRAIIDARARIEALNSRIGQLENRINELERSLQNSAQSQIQLLNENERLRSEIARVRGQIEESNRASSSGKSQQKDLYIDLDKRLDEQRKSMAALEEKLQQLSPVTVELNGVNYRVSVNERAQFEELQSALNAREFKKAIRLAVEFERENANSALLGDVLFLRGTALYADKDIKSSIASRRDLIRRFPNHPTIPLAMLNLAAGLEETGNPANARRTLEELIKAHPKSAAAAEARKRLK